MSAKRRVAEPAKPSLLASGRRWGLILILGAVAALVALALKSPDTAAPAPAEKQAARDVPSPGVGRVLGTSDSGNRAAVDVRVAIDSLERARAIEVLCRCAMSGIPVDATLTNGRTTWQCIQGRCIVECAPGDRVILAEADGYMPSRLPVGSSAAATIIELSPGNRCRITVRDADGLLVVGAALELIAPAPGVLAGAAGALRERNRIGRTDAGGVCSIGSSQRMVVRAMNEDGASRLALVPVGLEDLELVLLTEADASVTVVDSENPDCLAGRIDLVRTDLGLPVPVSLALDAAGRCRPALEPGDYYLERCQFPYLYDLSGDAGERAAGDAWTMKLSPGGVVVLQGTRMPSLPIQLLDRASGQPVFSASVWLESYENDERVGRVGWSVVSSPVIIEVAGGCFDAGRLWRGITNRREAANVRIGVCTDEHMPAHISAQSLTAERQAVLMLDNGRARSIVVRLLPGAAIEVALVESFTERGPISVVVAGRVAVVRDGGELGFVWRGGDVELRARTASGPVLQRIDAGTFGSGANVTADLRDLGRVVVHGVPDDCREVFLSLDGLLLFAGSRTGASVSFTSLPDGQYHLGTMDSHASFRMRAILGAQGAVGVSRGATRSVLWEVAGRGR